MNGLLKQVSLGTFKFPPRVVVATQMELMLKSEGVLHMEEQQDWPLIEKVQGGKKTAVHE